MTPRFPKAAVRRDGERGFALLIVFLFAAAVALMLYQQMPRVAFESEREKEQMLQDRGKEYVRGIQLYYTAFKRYPAKLEDLENTNNKRFLRKRYIDPMTGKDEWRLIHANVAGQLIDSVVTKPPSPTTGNGNSSDPNNPLSAFGTGAGSTTSGTGTPTDQPTVNQAVLRRPSDNTLVPPGTMAPPPNVDPNDPRYWPPTTTVPLPGANPIPGVGNPQFPGQQFPGQQFPGQQLPGQQFPGAGQTFPGGQQQVPGQQQFPGQQQYPGQQLGSLPGGFQPGLPGQNFPPGVLPNNPNQNNPNQTSPLPNPQQSGGVPGGIMPTGGVFGFPQNGQGGAGAAGASPTSPNDALGTINNALRTPQQQQTGGTNAIGVGGLVGVASTSKAPSIKIYKDRQKYNEWEFIFDLKQAVGPGQQPGLGQNAPNQNRQPGQGPPNPNPNANPGFSPIFPTTGTPPPPPGSTVH